MALAMAHGRKNPTGKFVHTEDGKIQKFVTPFGKYSADKRKDIMEKAFKFTFVRHPFERLVSAYRSKMIGIKRKDK